MARFFPIVWTSQGIVHHPRPYRRQELEDDPLLTTNIQAIVLRWEDPWALRMVEPWPHAVLRWSGGEVPIGPRWGAFHAGPEEVAERLEALVTHLEARSPAKVSARGWLDVPEQPWERVRGLPELPTTATLGEGAFRSAPRPLEERVVAVRTKVAPFEAMLGWLASRPERPWRDHPRQVRLTETFLYVERRDQSVWRIPLESLRSRRGATTEDAMYVFGRRSSVVLTHRDGCPVRSSLDERLDASA